MDRPRKGAVSDSELLASRLQNNTFLLFKQNKTKRKRIKQSPQPLFPLCTKNPGSLAKCPLHLGDGRGPFWGKIAPEKSPPKRVCPMQSSQKPARSPPEARNCWRGCPGHTGPAPGCRQGRSPQGPRSAGEPPAGGRETSCSCRRPGLHVPMRQKEGRVKRGCCEGRDPFNVNMWCQNQSFRRRWGAACRPASPPPHDQRPQHFYSGVTGFPSDVGRVRGCWQHTWVAHAAQGGPPVTVCPPEHSPPGETSGGEWRGAHQPADLSL